MPDLNAITIKDENSGEEVLIQTELTPLEIVLFLKDKLKDERSTIF